MAKKITTKELFIQGLWTDNPVLRQILGICSTLAVTNLMVNTLVMNVGLMFTVPMSSLTVSLLRKYTPLRIRMMVQTLIIASYVIVFDIVIQAQLPRAPVDQLLLARRGPGLSFLGLNHRARTLPKA